MADDRKGNASDHNLLHRIQRGDDDAAYTLYMRYAERLIGLAGRSTPTSLANRFDPEDIVQSVFRTFFRRASAGQYTVPEGEELWKLLLVIALNKVRARGAFHRASKRDVTRTSDLDMQGDSVGDDRDAARHMLEMSINEVLEKLPLANQQIIRLRIEGYEMQDIATRVERSKRTVERVLQDFRKELLHAIDD